MIERQCKQCGSADLKPHCRLCEACRATPNPRCKKCKKVKPLSRFSHDASRPSGYFPWCMDCQVAGVKAGAFQSPDDEPNGHICPMDDVIVRGHANRRFCSNGCKDKAKDMRSKYNLTPAQYRAIIDANAGLCPLCKGRATSWQMDHDHNSLRVMGAVCSNCNVRGLAYTYHSIEYVRRLLDFLEHPPALRAGVDALANPDVQVPSQLHRTWGYRKKKNDG